MMSEELGEMDPSQLQGFFRDDGAFVQIMPDGQQIIYLPDGQMGYLGSDGAFNPIDLEFGDGSASRPSAEPSPDPLYNPSATASMLYAQQQPQQQQMPPSGASSTAATVAAYDPNSLQQFQFPPKQDRQPLQQQQQQQKSKLPDVFQQQQQAQQSTPLGPIGSPIPPNPYVRDEAQPPPLLVQGLPPLFETELRHGYWPNLIIELFTSAGFKVYFCYLLWSSAVLVFFIATDWMFGSLARVYHPPVEEDTDWQSMGFLGILVVVSMFMATTLTLIIHMAREMWRLTPQDVVFWGAAISDTVPPWQLYAVIMLTVTLLPFFWALGLASDNQFSGIYFGQFYFFITHIITLWIVALNYLWFYALALKRKYVVWHERAQDPADDEDEVDPHVIMRRQQEWEAQVDAARNETAELRQNAAVRGAALAQQEEVDPLTLRAWYRSPAMLFEMGLDSSSIAWSVFSFVFGLIALLIVATILATQGTQPVLSALWVVALVAFVAVLAIMLFVRKRGKRISIYTNLFFVLIFFVLVMVGCGHSPFSGMFGLFLVPLTLLQFMLLRKREYVMRSHEIQALFGGTVEEVVATTDTYMVVAKKCIAALLSHFVNVKNFFGVRHPLVIAADKEMRKQRASLYLDLRVLFHLWFVFWLMLCTLAGLSATLPWPTVSRSHSSPTQRTNSSTSGGNSNNNNNDLVRSTQLSSSFVTLDGTALPFCQYTAGIKKTVNSSTVENATIVTVGPFTVYELALFALLAESHGENFDRDFTAWFRGPKSTNSINVLPNPTYSNRVPPSNARQPEFLDFYDNATGNHAIVVRAASNRGGTLLRNIDMIADSATLQLASIFAPTVSVWPLHDKRRFVAGIADVKAFASSSNVTGDIDAYVRALHMNDERAVIVGFGFNGVIATIAGSNARAPVVTFNSPGTSLLADKYNIAGGFSAAARKHAMHVRTSKSLVGLFDQADDVGTTQVIECAGKGASDYGCDSIPLIAQLIGALCGDEKGRVVYA